MRGWGVETEAPGIESADLGVHDCRKMFPFHSTLKKLWVEGVSVKECSNSLRETPPISTSPCQSVWFIYPARGNAGVQGRGTTHICCDYQMWEGETSLLQGPHPTVGKSIIPDTGGAYQALSFANQSTFSFNQCPSPRETPSLMSFFVQQVSC